MWGELKCLIESELHFLGLFPTIQSTFIVIKMGFHTSTGVLLSALHPRNKLTVLSFDIFLGSFPQSFLWFLKGLLSVWASHAEYGTIKTADVLSFLSSTTGEPAHYLKLTQIHKIHLATVPQLHLSWNKAPGSMSSHICNLLLWLLVPQMSIPHCIVTLENDSSFLCIFMTQ